jgi:anthranilate 1,2-dioxygenase small subunit
MSALLREGLLDRLRVEELCAAYIRCIDDDRLEDWPEFFTEDCTYGIYPRENVDAGLPIPLLLCTNRRMLHDRILSHREANIYAPHSYRHFVSGLHVTRRVDGGMDAVSNYLVVRTSEEGESAIYQTGQVFDRIVEVINGGLLFAERRFVYDTLRVQTLLTTPI